MGQLHNKDTRNEKKNRSINKNGDDEKDRCIVKFDKLAMKDKRDRLTRIRGKGRLLSEIIPSNLV